ncbi:MAG: Holliday junction resolvase RuvX [Pseudomonadota bacterium]
MKSTTLSPPPHLWLGFDFGERRIGVAVGQSITGQARPLAVLPTRQRGQPDWAAIERIVQEWSPAGVVVGVPRRDDGSDYPLTAQAERFARQLHGRYHLRTETADERLSSYEASARLGFGKQQGALDAAAAAVILETWFAQQHTLPAGNAHVPQ